MAEAAAVSVDGWDFSWLDGRVLEERPPWGFQGVMAERMAGAKASLDLQTGGGDVLAGAAMVPPLAVATARLHPLGVAVVAVVSDNAFDLVTSRHPVKAWMVPGFTVEARKP